MSMIILNNTIDRLRADATAEKTSHRQRTEAVRADRTLSPEGKQQQIASLYAASKKRLDDMREKESSAIATERSSLERAIFGNVTTDPSALIAYRDAQDRALQLQETDADRASDILRSASLSSDATLAAAVLSRALTFSANPFGPAAQWQRIIDEYAEKNPSRSTALRDLQSIDQYPTKQDHDPFNGWHSAYGIDTPFEIQGKSDATIQTIATTTPTLTDPFGTNSPWS